jgi:ubiquinone biosynthesis protein
MGKLLDDFFAILRRHQMRCPADIVYLIKALTTIEGVAQEIAPEFDLVSYVKPYVENLIKQRYSVSGIRKRVQDAMISYADLIEDLPQDVANLLRAVRQNQLSVPLEHRGLERLNDELERASMNVSWSLVISSLIVGAAILVLADHMNRQTSALTWIALAGLVVGGVFGVWRLIRARWRKR